MAWTGPGSFRLSWPGSVNCSLGCWHCASARTALDRLHKARAQLWQLWAAALDVPDPQYGLTSILDFAPYQLPAALQGTASDLDTVRLLAAARCLAAQLHKIADHLPDEWREALPRAMAAYVTQDMQQPTAGA